MVVGIDPGTRCMGFGVVARRGAELLAVDHGAFRPRRAASVAERLHTLHQSVLRLLKHHRPDVLALEQAFHQKNVQSALRLGEVRGAVLVAACSRDVPVMEYAPAVAKKAVTGNGGASKEQVQAMVQDLLGLETVPEPHDAADALALALCLIFDPALDTRYQEHSAGS